MNKHYFFTLSKKELEEKKQEYFNTNIIYFAKKYKISTKTLVFLFWKKWMKWRVWKKIKLETNNNKIYIKTQNKLDCNYFKKWLYKKNIDTYYTKLINKN